MPSIVASLRRKVLIVRFNAAGDDVASVQEINALEDDSAQVLNAFTRKTWTKAEAGAAGVTGAELAAFLSASETLRAAHETELLGP